MSLHRIGQLATTALAVGIYALSSWPPLAQVSAALMLALSCPACAGELPQLVTANAMASEVLTWVDAIERFIGDRADASITGSLERVRGAASALQHASRGRESIERGDLAAAKTEMRRALDVMYALVRPVGIRSGPLLDGLCGASPDGAELVVPTADELMTEAP